MEASLMHFTGKRKSVQYLKLAWYGVSVHRNISVIFWRPKQSVPVLFITECTENFDVVKITEIHLGCFANHHRF